MIVKPGLCGTLSETQIVGFLTSRLTWYFQTIYEGTVGNRMVILRENDKGVASRGINGYPTIEITTESGTPDKVFYMGKEWIYQPRKN